MLYFFFLSSVSDQTTPRKNDSFPVLLSDSKKKINNYCDISINNIKYGLSVLITIKGRDGHFCRVDRGKSLLS